jgi:hypothetical protein
MLNVVKMVGVVVKIAHEHAINPTICSVRAAATPHHPTTLGVGASNELRNQQISHPSYKMK